jgi:stearoyl-CoA desaturase (delta-9 desaturase)
VSDSLWAVLVLIFWTIVITQTAVFAISIYLHRGLAHRALTLHPGAAFACRVVIWLLLGLKRQEWVAVHRKHHTFTDVAGDPHSPQLVGIWRVWFGNVALYLREARKPEVLATWAPDIAPDAWDRWVFSRGLTGLALGAAILYLALGWQGLVGDLIHGTLNAFLLAPIVNGLGHWRGQKSYANTAYNIGWLAWITGGESLHNNHHADPRSPRFSMAERETDPTWWVIRCLETAGLASTHRRD